MVQNVAWLGHDSFRFTGDRVVYIDPWKLAPGGIKADLILVTHDHHDHLSKVDIEQLSKEDTVVVGPAAVAAKLGGAVTVVKPGDRITAAGVPVEVVPAYNLNKKFHPQRRRPGRICHHAERPPHLSRRRHRSYSRDGRDQSRHRAPCR